MQTFSLSHALARMQRLRRMIDQKRTEPLSSHLDLLRLQALFLKAQRRLINALVPQMPQPVRVMARGPSRR